jgi:PAS domain S-box-containing protein
MRRSWTERRRAWHVPRIQRGESMHQRLDLFESRATHGGNVVVIGIAAETIGRIVQFCSDSIISTELGWSCSKRVFMSQSLRMLIVEDSKDDADLLVRAVRAGGYEPVFEVVDTAPGMRVALERADWDLITSDHSMPEFGAPAALALAKELRPRVPFIIVSGEIDLNLAVSLMKAGAHDYVQKSELARLVPAIARVLRETEFYYERKRMEHSLEASEARYRRLFETAQDGILILDEESGHIMDANPFLVDMLGYSREHCLGKKLWEIGAFKDIEACKASFAELQKNGYIRYEDQPLETKDGHSIAVEFVSNVYLVDDQKVIQCNIRDISARKAAETGLRSLNSELDQRVQERTSQLVAVNRELETFNYSVSHDLRAPVRRIQGFVEVLQKEYPEKLDLQGQNLIQSISASAQHMDSLINALLRLARLSRGELNAQRTDLSSLVQSIGAEVQRGDPSRQVEFVVAEGIFANGDRALLRILVENLLNNAWKFTSHSPTARIEFGVSLESDGTQAYFVKDDGAGFDMKYASTIFGAFQRFHSQDEFPGTGIGLASVQRIVHRHRGKIWAQSAKGKGATFYFTLEPFCDAEQSAPLGELPFRTHFTDLPSTA